MKTPFSRTATGLSIRLTPKVAPFTHIGAVEEQGYRILAWRRVQTEAAHRYRRHERCSEGRAQQQEGRERGAGNVLTPSGGSCRIMTGGGVAKRARSLGATRRALQRRTAARYYALPVAYGCVARGAGDVPRRFSSSGGSGGGADVRSRCARAQELARAPREEDRRDVYAGSRVPNARRRC
eukprot:IDg12082t1